jgi:hypothetical protein
VCRLQRVGTPDPSDLCATNITRMGNCVCRPPASASREADAVADAALGSGPGGDGEEGSSSHGRYVAHLAVAKHTLEQQQQQQQGGATKKQTSLRRFQAQRPPALRVNVSAPGEVGGGSGSGSGHDDGEYDDDEDFDDCLSARSGFSTLSALSGTSNYSERRQDELDELFGNRLGDGDEEELAEDEDAVTALADTAWAPSVAVLKAGGGVEGGVLAPLVSPLSPSFASLATSQPPAANAAAAATVGLHTLHLAYPRLGSACIQGLKAPGLSQRLLSYPACTPTPRRRAPPPPQTRPRRLPPPRPRARKTRRPRRGACSRKPRRGLYSRITLPIAERKLLYIRERVSPQPYDGGQFQPLGGRFQPLNLSSEKLVIQAFACKRNLYRYTAGHLEEDAIDRMHEGGDKWWGCTT